jgi:hypothetical protein
MRVLCLYAFPIVFIKGRAMTPTARLRVIDALRMHVPVPSERERLKLSGGDRDRLAIGPDKKVTTRKTVSTCRR